MKTTMYKFKITGLLIIAFMMIAGFSQSQNNCVPDSLTVTNVTEHSADLNWSGISGPTWARYYVTGTTEYEYRFTNGDHVRLCHLTPNTAYSWDLNNFCNGEWTGYTGNGSFTTLADTIPPPTCIPTDLTAANATARTVDLSWSGISGPTWARYYVTGTTEYEYRFTAEDHVQLRHLTPNTSYSWDLNNFCNGEWTGYNGNGSFTTLADTIPPPTCIPTDLTAANITARAADLSWSGISGPTWARYYPTGTTEYEYRFTGEDHVQLRHLTPNTAYTWDLNNFCNGEWTGYTGNGAFTTLADTIPPPTCIPTDLAAANVTARAADLSWSGISGPTWARYYPTGTTEYEYKFTDQDHVMLRHLTPNTAYSWDLNNFCNGEWTGYAGSGSFTTLADTIPPPTCIPTDLTATNVTAHSAELSWGGISGPTQVRYYPTGTTNYEFREAHMNHVNLHNLLPETPYSWDLSNFCNGEWTPFTGDGSFTTLTDTIPSPTCIPTDLSATNVTAHSAELSWGGISGPTQVRYYPTGTTDYEFREAHMNHINLHNLLPETPYSWDLSNFCNGEWTPFTGDGSFTTLADTFPPPTCIPTDLTATNVTANSAELSWGGISGPTHLRYYPAGTTGYMYWETHMNHVTLDSLTPNTTYVWDLSNFCNGEWTAFTGNGTFTTLSETYITGIINADGQSTAGLSNLSVYPNPMRAAAVVTFTAGEAGSYLYKIIDITGRELTSANAEASRGANSFELNLTGNPKGIYFLKIQKGNEVKHIKLLKE